ncbi:hypothetical protein [Arthrobacter sp. StoSoilA2]|uniref:hypothetical protein n=1 Tax=Arthrobacter sp. StoSoilA2 TaxID=2830990 RepID=UPI0031FF2E65
MPGTQDLEGHGRGMHLHGRLENIDDGDVTFSDDLPERLATVESSFNQRMRKAIDAYIAAAGIDAEQQPPTPEDDWLPSEPARLNLAQANITSILWATGYKLDLSFIDIPVLDEWGYPKHTAGVTEQPGLYAVGLPWLTRHYSSILGGVGLAAEYVAGKMAQLGRPGFPGTISRAADTTWHEANGGIRSRPVARVRRRQR